MASNCELCKKNKMRGNLVSHSKRRTKRVFKLNLHSMRMVEGKGSRIVLVCNSCRKKYNLTNKIKKEKLEKIRLEQLAVKKLLVKEKIKEEVKVEEREKIPEEVVLKMKVKSAKKKDSMEDMSLVEEIIAKSNEKEKKKSR